ncbi:hypothetical protein NDU88_002445 [Pleurodeles waltl]|uniref:Uncharacterized protein n=1 Tax=Pleurodeles waltl TaxID=8319 RepID=A0AAV7MNV5_PLEWA|nr:hypothetical protein NDU88_002445 [Pleurodeles waltl]
MLQHTQSAHLCCFFGDLTLIQFAAWITSSSLGRIHAPPRFLTHLQRATPGPLLSLSQYSLQVIGIGARPSYQLSFLGQAAPAHPGDTSRLPHKTCEDLCPSAGLPRARPVRAGPLRCVTTAIFKHFAAVRYHARPPPGPTTPHQSSICSGRPRLTTGPLSSREKGSIMQEASLKTATAHYLQRTGAATLQSGLHPIPSTSPTLYCVCCGIPAMLGMDLG